MNKKFLPIVILVLLLVVGGVFWWRQTQETPPEEWEKAEYSKSEDYVVKETAEGKIVENKKAGLSFRIPEGWRVEKPPPGVRDFIRLYSSKAEEKNILIIEKGCRIVPDVQYITASIDTIREELAKDIWKPYLISTEIIKIDTQESLKYIAESPELKFYRVGVGIPVRSIFPFKKNKVYSFVLDSAFQDKEKCLEIFNEFLKTISIE